MPVYKYMCEDCSVAKKINKSDLYDNDNEINGYHSNGEYLFFKKYTMKDKINNPKCPKCGGRNTRQSFLDNNLVCYIRGDGIVKDVAGARRDMNKHHLLNQDPYGYMRQPGEVDDMLDKMRDAGRVMDRVRKRKAESSQKAKKRADKIKDMNLSNVQEDVLIKINQYGGKCLFSDLNNIEDISGVLSSLMPDYVCKSGDVFMLMAAGRSYVDRLINSY